MNRKTLIEPRTLKGFRDYLPAQMIPREWLIDTARRVYRSFGFLPIDTPALEYIEVLLGKGGGETDKQMYRFEDNGGREVGMRFDLTVPLARFAAQHFATLGTPFKRYHVATVWRGENTSRGRYREFMQCDFDTIGTRALAADVETGLVVHDLMHALGVHDFTIQVNNRAVLAGLLELLELSDKAAPLLRALDKLDKIGAGKVAEEMIAAAGATAAQADSVLALAAIEGDNDQILVQLGRLVAKSETGSAGVQRLAELMRSVIAAGAQPARWQVRPAVARGLDYYTGMIFETYLDALPAIGSVCSGGRYDNLADLFTTQELPGIGASLGLDRLLSALEELGLLPKSASTAPVFIPFFDADRLHDYLRLAAALRAEGIGAELFPEPKKLSQQLKYADRRGFRFAVVIGADEFAARTCQVKDMASGQSTAVSLAGGTAALVDHIRRALAK